METRSTFTFVTCQPGGVDSHTFFFLRSFHLCICFLVTPNLPSICHGIGFSNLSVSPAWARSSSSSSTLLIPISGALERDKYSDICVHSDSIRFNVYNTHTDRTYADISSAYYAWIYLFFFFLLFIDSVPRTLYQPCTQRTNGNLIAKWIPWKWSREIVCNRHAVVVIIGGPQNWESSKWKKRNKWIEWGLSRVVRHRTRRNRTFFSGNRRMGREQRWRWWRYLSVTY